MCRERGSCRSQNSLCRIRWWGSRWPASTQYCCRQPPCPPPLANVAEASDKIGTQTVLLSCREDYGTSGEKATLRAAARQLPRRPSGTRQGRCMILRIGLRLPAADRRHGPVRAAASGGSSWTARPRSTLIPPESSTTRQPAPTACDELPAIVAAADCSSCRPYSQALLPQLTATSCSLRTGDVLPLSLHMATSAVLSASL